MKNSTALARLHTKVPEIVLSSTLTQTELVFVPVFTSGREKDLRMDRVGVALCVCSPDMLNSLL